jgi:cardiolipin hydrolase
MNTSVNIAFSPGEKCRELIIDLIVSANSTLDICVFTISDDLISNALLKAFQKGIEIRIITDNDKTSDLGSDVEKLYYQGIEVKTDITEYHMHHKFMIMDKKTVLTGSYNWTRNAAIYNQENIISLTDSEIAQRFQEEFNRLWKDSADLMN